MVAFHIVTDSSARLALPYSARTVQPQAASLTILANRIEVNGQTYREDIDITSEDLLKLIAQQSVPPKIHPPTSEDFLNLYMHLAKKHEAIISLHPSYQLSASSYNARQAAQQLAGTSCPIVVMDSGTLCVGLGILVRYAVQLAQNESHLDRFVQQVRGASERVYSLYIVDSLEFLEYNRIVSPSRAILGTILGIKPLVSLEQGHLQVVEKVRTRAQAVDRLVEFLVEFVDLEEAFIVQPRPHLSETARLLQDRLATDVPQRQFPYTLYGATLARWIGTDALGVVVLERDF
ncbi:MAG: DegV family EDD domain-containing protein [Anaerolineae bacterium]|nr:DegV family EDD domain-containing protein [Anaerolineae bacterium]MDW8172446.1 DegV family protein [Anaerolineae bacterium]